MSLCEKIMSKQFLSPSLLVATNLLVASIFLSGQTIAFSQSSNSTDTATSPAEAGHRVLQGGVKHQEHLDPVPSYLMSGAKFDEETMPKMTPGNNWIRIPEWMAGTWQFKIENVTDMVNYTKEHYTPAPYTLRNEAQKIFGQQKDKAGHPWHYLKAPYSYITKLDHGRLGYDRITSTELLSADDNQVVLKIIGTDTQVKGKKVTLTDQAEDFNHYTPLGSDSLTVGGSAKHFDMDGQPTMDITSNMIAKRIKPFEVIDAEDGENLKQSFIDYLKSHGQADLVP